MSNYNLSDNVQDTFNFELRGKKYSMRYPRTEEVEKVQEMTDELREAQDSNDKEHVSRVNTQMEDFLYGFITPEGHETPIREALAKENVKVMKNFNTMIKTELAI